MSPKTKRYKLREYGTVDIKLKHHVSMGDKMVSAALFMWI